MAERPRVKPADDGWGAEARRRTLFAAALLPALAPPLALIVILGLDPRIHATAAEEWIVGSSPRMTVVAERARVKPADDDWGV